MKIRIYFSKKGAKRIKKLIAENGDGISVPEDLSDGTHFYFLPEDIRNKYIELEHWNQAENIIAFERKVLAIRKYIEEKTGARTRVEYEE